MKLYLISRAGVTAFTASILLAGVGAPSKAATVIQPDIRVGVTYLDNAGFTGEEDFDATGGELDARLTIGFIDERNAVTVMPMIRVSKYSEDRVTDREEQRLGFEWLHSFETAAAKTTIDFQRQDLFSSEFQDASLDPDEIPDLDDPSSGFVDVDSTRDRAHLRQDFVKSIGLRNAVVFGIDYADISYDDSGTTARVDYDEVQIDAAWRRMLSERTSVMLRVGAGQYDGDNDLTADSLIGGLGFDVDVSETANLFVQAGYERIDREDNLQDLGSSGEFIFSVGGEKSTELTRFRGLAFRNVRPTSVGGVTNQTGLAFYLDRKLSQRVTFGAAISASRQERNESLAIDDGRDYLSGGLELSWRLSQQWFLEASVRHSQQEFESPLFVGGVSSDDRSKFFLNLRYRGLSEVPVRNDNRFLRKGY